MHSIEQISKNRIKEIVKLHQKKFRDEQGIFIAEGFKILEELIETNADIIDIFALNSTDTTKIKRKITIVDENTMKKISTTDSPCEIITIARKKEQNTNGQGNFTRFPEETPVAMAYVPFQFFENEYETAVAFKKGTLFPELDKPFMPGGIK